MQVEKIKDHFNLIQIDANFNTNNLSPSSPSSTTPSSSPENPQIRLKITTNTSFNLCQIKQCKCALSYSLYYKCFPPSPYSALKLVIFFVGKVWYLDAALKNMGLR